MAAGVLVGSLLSGGAFVALGLDLESAAPLLAVVADPLSTIGEQLVDPLQDDGPTDALASAALDLLGLRSVSIGRMAKLRRKTLRLRKRQASRPKLECELGCGRRRGRDKNGKPGLP